MMKEMKQDRVALDRAPSLRSYDDDGRLHLRVTNLSKANVCPYYGHEISESEKHGLDPQKIYYLLRDPDELAKAAPTFNNLPLLDEHVLATARDHRPDNVAGSTGSHAVFEHPYLKNSIVVWAGDSIDKIESGEQKELSSAYRYDYDPTPGVYEGVKYDGVMRNIRGSHVAIVKSGRAGPDVVVGDSALIGQIIMAKTATAGASAVLQGALAVYARKAGLAMDGKPIDLGPLVEGVTAKNFKSRIPAIVLGFKRVAKDADIEDVAEVIEALAEILPPEAEADVKAAVEGAEGGEVNDDADAAEACIEMCRKLSPEDREKVIAGCQAMGGGEQAQDEKDDEKKDKAMDAAMVQARIREATKGMVSKTAMDAEIARACADAIAATTAHINGISDARRRVAPWVGELAMDFDSVEAVERKACDVLGIAHKGKHPDALMDIISARPKAGERSREAAPRTAMDAAAAKSFDERFGTSRIGHAA